MKEVYITMGLPCCGKTKYCYDHADSIANVYDIETFQETKKSEIVYIDTNIQTNKQLNIFFKLYLNKNIKIHIVYFKENRKQCVINDKYRMFKKKRTMNAEHSIKMMKFEHPDLSLFDDYDVELIEMDVYNCPKVT